MIQFIGAGDSTNQKMIIVKIIIGIFTVTGFVFLVIGICTFIGMRRLKKKVINIAEKSNLDIRAGRNGIRKVENES